MKALILKTLLVISAVVLTSMIAWAGDSAPLEQPAPGPGTSKIAVKPKTQRDLDDPCLGWNKDEICDPKDPNFVRPQSGKGSTEASTSLPRGQAGPEPTDADPVPAKGEAKKTAGAEASDKARPGVRLKDRTAVMPKVVTEPLPQDAPAPAPGKK